MKITMAKTILGIGAHYDDCVFGISGTLLKAVRKNYRVVILSLIGDYTNWKPVAGRAESSCTARIDLAKEYGVEMRFLKFAGMRFDVTEATKRAVAEVVAEIGPNVAFICGRTTRTPITPSRRSSARSPCGTATACCAEGSRFTRAAAHFSVRQRPAAHDRLRARYVRRCHRRVAAGQRVARPPDGPRPRRDVRSATKLDGSQQAKEALARYRGQTCGVRYSEAFRAGNAYPQEIWVRV